MFNNKKRVLFLTVIALMMAFSFCSTSFAESVQATLKAQYKAIKILLNGSQATLDTQPVIINGSTYLPLRALGNLFDKNIDWNATTQQVTITDKPNNELASLKAQIAEKDNQIILLQAQINAKTKSGSLSLSDMEDELNDTYEDYKDLDVKITLSGSKTKITVKVDVGSKSKWNNLSSSNQTKLLQNIVDDLNDEYGDPGISGTVKAGSTTIKTFTVNSSGTVKTSSSSGDFADLEDDLNDEYDELGDIDDLNIALDGDEDLITFTVEIDYDEFEDEWDKLTNSKIETYLKQMRTAIIDAVDDNDYDLDDYDDADVKGYIVNTSDDDDTMASISTSDKVTRDSSYRKK